MAKQDCLLLSMVISVIYILVFQNHSTNANQEEITIGRQCILEAIDMYNQFQTKICRNLTNADPTEWLPKQCLHMCKALRLTNCSSKGNSNSNILFQLNLSTVNRNIYFPISKYESVRCSDCHDINSIAINCNIDSLFDIKECSDLLNTASTKSTTARNISNNSAKTTIQITTASEEYLPTCKPCPLTSTVRTITKKEFSTFKDITTTSTSVEDIEKICQNNETMPTSSSQQGKQNCVSMHFLAATGFGGIIIGAVLTLLFVFILQKRTSQLCSRLAEEHSMENPAYNKDHRFSDQLYNTQSSQNEVYSEIKANFSSRKSVNNNSAKTTQHLKLKDKENDYDHLNDAFDTNTNDQSMYDHAQYISKTHSDQQVDKDNGFYTQTSLTNGDRSYVEVTGEGPEGFVLDIKKQTENVTNDNYFVLKKETD